MYNLTNLSNANNFVDLTVAINELSNSMFAIFMMLTLFIIIMIVFSQYDKKVVLMADSAVLALVGIGFFALNMIGWAALVVPMVMFFISLLIVFIKN